MIFRQCLTNFKTNNKSDYFSFGKFSTENRRNNQWLETNLSKFSDMNFVGKWSVYEKDLTSFKLELVYEN